MSVLPGANHHYRFLSLAGLRQYIDGTNGQLRPALVQAVVEAIDSRQQAEKTYGYLCFLRIRPSGLGWLGSSIGSCPNCLSSGSMTLWTVVTDVRQKLAKAGLRTCDGYVPASRIKI
ncbi:MAG: hypothetical protein ACLSH6_08065 [Limosilactobacillus pontis]